MRLVLFEEASSSLQIASSAFPSVWPKQIKRTNISQLNLIVQGSGTELEFCFRKNPIVLVNANSILSF